MQTERRSIVPLANLRHLCESEILSTYSLDRYQSFPTTPVRPPRANTVGEVSTQILSALPPPPRSRFVLQVDNAYVVPSAGVIVDLDRGAMIRHESLDWRNLPELRPIHKLVEPGNQNELTRFSGVTILINGLWMNSFYHFVTEALGKFFIAKEIIARSNFTRVLLEGLEQNFARSWSELLRIDKKAEPLPIGGFILERAIIPSYSQHCGWCSMDFAIWIRSIAYHYINKNLSERYCTRLYICGRKSRKLVNEDEIVDLLKDNSFVSIDPSTLSLEDQIQLFLNAQVIIAPHGGALVNILFCKKSTKILEFFGTDYINPCYAELANLTGGEYHYLLGEPCGNGNYLIDIQMIKLFLHST